LAFAEKQEVEQMIFGIYYGILVVMILYNLFIYFSLRKKTYLLYSTFIAFGTLCTATISGHTFQYIWSNLPWVANYSLAFSGFLYQIFFLLYAIAFLDLKKNLPRWVPVLYTLVVVYSALAIFSLFNIPIAIRIFAFIGVINFPLVIFLSIKCYLRGFTAARFFILAWFVFMVGVILYSLVTANVLPMNAFTRRLTDVGAVFAVILISFALADRYRLIKRAQEVMQNEMLEMQKDANEKLEKKVKERTQQLQMKSDEILTQNEELQQQQEEIIAQNEFIAGVNQQLKRQSKQTRESIQAAKAIQQAILPRPQRFKELPIADHFVIYKPKDIVSGDFYWVSKINTALNVESLPLSGGGLQLTTKKLTPASQEAVFMAVVDCTGHGVPGAFMSMIGNSLLNEIVNEARVFSPAKILTKLHEKVQQELKQTEDSRLNQGMDMCLCKIAPTTSGVQVTFTGAKRPLFYIKDGAFGELKGDRLSIGGWSKKARESFTEQTLELQAGDMLYLTTDGYVDTPNPQRKSFGTSRLKKLLASQANIAVAQQHENLETALNTYQLDADQRDDITMLGVRL
jgi:serine phosphatase RsbU (regulator of sigma subunit)